MLSAVRSRLLPSLIVLFGALGACGTEPVIVSSVEVPPTTLTALGEARPLVAVAKDANGAEIRGKWFVWRSMQPTVTTIDSATGLATAVANGTATITATADGVTGQGTLTVAQTRAQLAFTVQPGVSTAGEPLTPAALVEIRDARGNRVVGATDAVTISLGASPTGAALVGTTTVNGVEGVAAFPDLSLHKAGSYTLTASLGTLTGTSTVFEVTPAAPARLEFRTQPSTTTAGVAIRAVEVAITDAFGNTVPAATDGVTVGLSANPGTATLSGTLTVAAVAGIARFTDLSITKAATGYTLGGSSGSLAGVTSNAFSIAPGPAAQVSFAQPSDVQANAVMAPVVVTIKDSFGNAAADSVILTIGANPWGGPGTRPGTLSGTVKLSPVDGTVTYSDLRIDKPGDGYRLHATTGTASGESAPFHVKLTFSTVVAGVTHTCSLTGSGAYCWGNNYDGRLGSPTGPTGDDSVPVFLNAGLTFTGISVGANQSCGVTLDNSAYCWGHNDRGELGNGTTQPNLTPAPVKGGIRFASVNSGWGHTCGLTTDGAAYCWGDNTNGALGDGTTTNRWVPVLVVGSGTTLVFTSISAGEDFSCALANDHSAYCWGANAAGQLGDGTKTNSPTPVRVSGSGTTLVFSSLSANTDHACALTTTHDVYCWGYNESGQLGSGSSTLPSPTPSLVTGGLQFASVSAGAGYSCGVTTGNVAYCWGFNPDGRLGIGTTGNQYAPVAVSGSLAFVSVSAGFHACGVTTAGEAYCWGPNNYGQVGDGTQVNPRLAPVRVIQ